MCLDEEYEAKWEDAGYQRVRKNTLISMLDTTVDASEQFQAWRAWERGVAKATEELHEEISRLKGSDTKPPSPENIESLQAQIDELKQEVQRLRRETWALRELAPRHSPRIEKDERGFPVTV